jgi:glyoxylase-like metal-dependent hydrolase (beta-lactamase superfamily II)
VTSTLIYGPTEAFLVDAQFRAGPATRLADLIDARGVRLKAILITHPHEDHYLGLAILLERFPDTTIVITPRALRAFQSTVAERLAVQRKQSPTETPDTLPTPQLLSGNDLSVDGQGVRLLADLQGDFGPSPSNTAVWVPSLRAVVAGDLAFEGVHPWLAGSTAASRRGWRDALAQLQALHPALVICGHKREAADPDAPASLGFTARYIEDFDRARATAPDGAALVNEMTAKYPGLGGTWFLKQAAETAAAN